MSPKSFADVSPAPVARVSFMRIGPSTAITGGDAIGQNDGQATSDSSRMDGSISPCAKWIASFLFLPPFFEGHAPTTFMSSSSSTATARLAISCAMG